MRGLSRGKAGGSSLAWHFMFETGIAMYHLHVAKVCVLSLCTSPILVSCRSASRAADRTPGHQASDDRQRRDVGISGSVALKGREDFAKEVCLGRRVQLLTLHHCQLDHACLHLERKRFRKSRPARERDMRVASPFEICSAMCAIRPADDRRRGVATERVRLYTHLHRPKRPEVYVRG